MFSDAGSTPAASTSLRFSLRSKLRLGTPTHQGTNYEKHLFPLAKNKKAAALKPKA